MAPIIIGGKKGKKTGGCGYKTQKKGFFSQLFASLTSSSSSPQKKTHRRHNKTRKGKRRQSS